MGAVQDVVAVHVVVVEGGRAGRVGDHWAGAGAAREGRQRGGEEVEEQREEAEVGGPRRELLS